MNDTRNVTNEFKNVPHDEIVNTLDERGMSLEIAIENLERDFNMGTIIRNSNAFGVRKVHVIGSRQWNKRGAMMTDKYLKIIYHKSVDDFIEYTNEKVLIAIDNVEGSVGLTSTHLDKNAVMIFGSEGQGISDELLKRSDKIVAIEQFGSTRSINVGVAAGVAMYEWVRRNKLT